MALRLPTADAKAAGSTLGKPEVATRQKNWLRSQLEFRQWSLQLRKGEDGALSVLNITKSGEVQAAIRRSPSDGYHHGAFGFSPDGQTIFSGGGLGVVAAYRLDGTKILDFAGHEGTVWGLAVSPDGKYLVTCSDDQTVRLWNAKTGELIVTLFDGADGDWVMWTPQGYFTGSPAGEKIIGWQINRGPDQVPDYVTGNQLRDHFYRPEIVERAIRLASAREAISSARGVDFELRDLATHQPPRFRILSPASDSHIDAASAKVVLRFDTNPDPIEPVEVLVEGKKAEESEMRGANARGIPANPYSVEVPLETGKNHVRIVARNKTGQFVQEFILFRDAAQPVVPSENLGDLYVVAIGTDKYSQIPPQCGASGHEPCDLRFAGRDARDFLETLTKNTGPLFRQMKAVLLTSDGEKHPTKGNIEEALALFKQARRIDKVILFVAGHGETEDSSGDYIYLPENAQQSGGEWLDSTVLPWTTFERALKNSHASKLMFVDTCHAAGAYNARLENNSVDAGIVVFSATDTDTLSYEFEEIHHGAFTYALIQGLMGKASRRDGTVTVFGLGEYVSDWVTTRTEDKQQPTFFMSNTKNFTLVRHQGATPAAN